MQSKDINSIISFVRKYKVLHVLFWTWDYIGFIHVYKERFTDTSLIYYEVTVLKFFQIVCVYFVIHFLKPRFFNKKKYTKFIALVLTSIFISVTLILVFKDISFIIYKNRHILSSSLLAMYIGHGVDLCVLIMIFFALYIIHDRYYSEKRANASEREKLINELNFLKAQLNPHFLFNAINSIYVLIDEDKKLASKTLLKFSALLRYQLYDCTQDWMPVEREFEFIKDYVDLEKMRNNDNLDVSFKFSDQTLNLQIAPFILLPFVENAFKHRSYNIQDNSVVITANFKDNFLVFSVTNSYDEFKIKKDEGGGIGLLNVYRRLQLAYPDKHKIDVSKKEGKYKINLELQLYENALYNSR